MVDRGNSIRAGGAFVDITARVSRQFHGAMATVRRTIGRVSASLNQTANRIGAIAGAALAPITLLTKQFAKLGDEIGKAAKRTGLTTEALSRLKFAAEQSGSNLTELEAGLKRQARFLLDSERGLAANVDALQRLNIELEELQALSPEEQFKLIGGRLGAMTDATKKAALAQVIFGRAGTKLIPLFNEGADAIDALGKEAEELGIVMSRETAAAAEEMTDGFNRVKQSVAGLAIAVGKVLAGDVKQMTARMVSLIKQTRKWLEENAQVIRSVVTLSLKALALAVALKAVAAALGVIALLFTPGAVILTGMALIAALLPTIRQGFIGMLDINSEANEHLSVLDKIQLAWVQLSSTIEATIADLKEGFFTLAAFAAFGHKDLIEAAKDAAVQRAEAEDRVMLAKTKAFQAAEFRRLDAEESARRLEESRRRSIVKSVEKRPSIDLPQLLTGVALGAPSIVTAEVKRAQDVIKFQGEAGLRRAEQDLLRQQFLAAAGVSAKKDEPFGPKVFPDRTRGITADTGLTLVDVVKDMKKASFAQLDEEKKQAGALTVGTFSARFAGQIVAGQKVEVKQLDQTIKNGQTLEQIEKNTRGGARAG